MADGSNTFDFSQLNGSKVQRQFSASAGWEINKNYLAHSWSCKSIFGWMQILIGQVESVEETGNTKRRAAIPPSQLASGNVVVFPGNPNPQVKQ